ncbi:MAG TPA: CoA transferase [Anaerovoracaceae bacterium]|nr:CoA transferase [Anaerovoracaceae bacterium]
MKYEKKPLEGIVVIDFTRVYSGPYCTLMLADLGAEIIKVERKDLGDDSRQFLPLLDANRESGYFMYLNRNKKSIELDLKDPKAREVVYRLCRNADMVVENYAPGVAARLGIDYESIKKYNPGIIYGSISGFGQTGPYKNKAAYDVVAQAMGGNMAISGFKDGPPVKLGNSIADASAGIHMAYGLLGALYYRDKTGVGQYVDVAMMDTVFSTLENFVVMQTYAGITPTRNGNANLGAAPFNTFTTKDGYVAIAVANDALFEKFTTAINRRDLLEVPMFKDNKGRKTNENILNAIVNEWTSQHTAKEVCEIMDEAKVPVGPILGIDELMDDPQIKDREMLVEIEHPTEGKIKFPGNPIKYSETKIEEFKPAPLLGQDTDEILLNFGDYSEEEIKALREAGIISSKK